MQNKVFIIGGGIGGLFCGAILAKEGYQVLVSEKHRVAGGGLHMFKRHGIEFESGMHMISGFEENGVLRSICRYLGIFDKLRIKRADADGFDQLCVASDGITYKFAVGKQKFIESLCHYFPEESENIISYVNKVYEVCDDIALFNLRAPSADIYSRLDVMNTSVGDFIASFTQNKKLQAVLAWNNSLYAGIKDKTPAYIGALITKLYVEGASHFVGGSQQLADALVDVIKQHGGEVMVNNGVKWIEVEDKKIQKIVTDDGREYTADWYISAIHTSSLFKLMDLSKLQKSYYNRIDSIPNSYSAFTTFIKLKPNSFPYLNHTHFFLPNYDSFWKQGDDSTGTWPRGLMYLTPPVTENDTYAEKLIINAVMTFDTVKQWEDTTVGRRGEDYTAFKNDCQERVLNMMEQTHPDIRSKIDKIFCSTPLTIRDYYNVKDGAIYGTTQDCTNMAASHIAIRTKLQNLLLSGQNLHLHGILGVPLTAISTCGELLGMENLLKKINHEEQINS